MLARLLLSAAVIMTTVSIHGCLADEPDEMSDNSTVERSAVFTTEHIYLSVCGSGYSTYGAIGGYTTLGVCCWESGRWVLRGSSNNLSSVGGHGDVVIRGTSRGDNILVYPHGVDCSVPGGGSRTLHVGGVDRTWVNMLTVDGLSGSDSIDGLDVSTADPRFRLHLFGGNGADYIFVGPGGGYANGDRDGDYISGSDQGDLIQGGDGADNIEANGGDDYVDGDNGNDTVHGGPGNDYLLGGRGADVLFGEEGRDILGGLDGGDELDGGPDEDWLFGDDTPYLAANSPDDWSDWQDCGQSCWFDTRNLFLAWEPGSDYLYGGSEDDAPDHIWGGEMDDVADGGDGYDHADGGDGNDTCTAEIRIDCEPHCGDGSCEELEDCGTCEADCGSCPICGDGHCDPTSETNASCAVDCPAYCGDGECNGDEWCRGCERDCGVCASCGNGYCDGDDDCTTCPGDCGTCDERCGDDWCTESESCTTCPGDCGTCPG